MAYAIVRQHMRESEVTIFGVKGQQMGEQLRAFVRV
jgi:hypothetical protein